MQGFYLKQLLAVPLLTPAYLSTTPSLFKHKTRTTENTTIWNLKLSLSLQLCPWVGVSQCWPSGLCCGVLPGGASWWQHSCQRHWPHQVLLVASVSLSALSLALLNNIQLSPRLCSSPGQELRDTGSICPQLFMPSLPRTASRSHQPQESLPLTPGTLWLVCSHSLLGPASGIANKDAMCEGDSYILLHTQAQLEPQRGCDWLIIPCRQTTPDLAFPQSEFDSYKALMPESLSIHFQTLQRCILLSSPPCFSSDRVTHGYS